ncbi:hypothetical protein HDV06_006765 [Boothiomyces sp. JEL0866]|nr:hypothetical protein HDV06_006765 [Boothiomyces sp. JEL0866]
MKRELEIRKKVWEWVKVECVNNERYKDVIAVVLAKDSGILLGTPSGNYSWIIKDSDCHSTSHLSIGDILLINNFMLYGSKLYANHKSFFALLFRLVDSNSRLVDENLRLIHQEQLKQIIEWASNLPEISFAKLQQVILPLSTPATKLLKSKSLKQLNLSNLRVSIVQVIGPTGITAAGKVNAAELFPIEYYTKEFQILVSMKHGSVNFQVDSTEYVKKYLDLYGTDLLSKISIIRSLLDSMLHSDHIVQLEQVDEEGSLKLIGIHQCGY